MGSEIITVDGEALEKASVYTKEFQNPGWMHIEGIAGYVFPQGGTLMLDKKVNTAAYLEAWLDHGVSPEKGTYAYILLPMKTAEQTAAYSENPDIEIISNTETLQVVREKNLNLTGMVFWEKGSLEDITVSEPMLVMERTDGADREISISDPTKLLTGATVTIEGTYEALECDKRLNVTNENGNTIITVDFAGSKGRSLAVSLKKKS